MPAEIMQLGVPDPLADVAAEYLGGGPVVLPDPSTRDEALIRAASIRAGIERFAREVVPAIAEAYRCRDWQALGYPSWESYVRGEFGLDRLKLPRGDRQHASAALRLVGMSTRAIGQALGVDQKTVVNDLRAAGPGEENSSPAQVLGADGKSYPATRPAPAPVEVVDAVVVDRVPAAASVPAIEPAAELVTPVPAPQPPPTPVVVDEGVELLAGSVRIRVRAYRRQADGSPVVSVRLVDQVRTIGEEWVEADSNDDALQLGAALDEPGLDDLIETLIDAKAQLRRMRGAE